MHPSDTTKGCAALLLGMNGKRKNERCDASASFVSRGHACCWVHYQADTKGPRAGKVAFRKRR